MQNRLSSRHRSIICRERLLRFFACKMRPVAWPKSSRSRATVLHEQVGARLRQRIVEGRIAPGAKLNERVLAEQLQVSRTPLREAIKLLAAEGLVELLPNRGAVAVKLTEPDVADTFEVIAGLEGQSGELAAQRISDAELAEIRALHYEMLAAFTRRDLSDLLPAQRDRSTPRSTPPRATRCSTQTYRTVNARAAGAALPLQLRRGEVEARGAGARARWSSARRARRRRHCARCWSSTWTTSATRCSS